MLLWHQDCEKEGMRYKNFVLFLAACLSLHAVSNCYFAQVGARPTTKAATAAFEDAVKDYMKLRNDIKAKLPKLSKDSTPEQIHSYMTSFEEQMRAARSNARQGDILRPEVSEFIRTTMREHFKGLDRKELRKTVLEAENQDVTLRVNYPYPESKEFSEMPATLLLKLPQLPKEIKYRFVRSNMLLVDRENNMIIDYMVKALP